MYIDTRCCVQDTRLCWVYLFFFTYFNEDKKNVAKLKCLQDSKVCVFLVTIYSKVDAHIFLHSSPLYFLTLQQHSVFCTSSCFAGGSSSLSTKSPYYGRKKSSGYLEKYYKSHNPLSFPSWSPPSFSPLYFEFKIEAVTVGGWGGTANSKDCQGIIWADIHGNKEKYGRQSFWKKK